MTLKIYPSATKNSPDDKVTTSAGLQKCLLSLPGINFVPNIKDGVAELGGNLKTCEENIVSIYSALNKSN